MGRRRRARRARRDGGGSRHGAARTAWPRRNHTRVTARLSDERIQRRAVDAVQACGRRVDGVRDHGLHGGGGGERLEAQRQLVAAYTHAHRVGDLASVVAARTKTTPARADRESSRVSPHASHCVGTRGVWRDATVRSRAAVAEMDRRRRAATGITRRSHGAPRQFTHGEGGAGRCGRQARHTDTLNPCRTLSNLAEPCRAAGR